mmetsp:Transcript_115972/g.182399  ORF Transcript_115972/g.182399 Transcript_115972/m.182399 type:complete len:458 (+) Transcript_115972:47-1420(+)
MEIDAVGGKRAAPEDASTRASGNPLDDSDKRQRTTSEERPSTPPQEDTKGVVEQPPVEQPPVEQAPVVQPPVEQPAVVQPPLAQCFDCRLLLTSLTVLVSTFLLSSTLASVLGGNGLEAAMDNKLFHMYELASDEALGYLRYQMQENICRPMSMDWCERLPIPSAHACLFSTTTTRTELIVTLQPGKLGMTIDPASGEINRVEDGGQASSLGLTSGARLINIGDYAYSYDVLKQYAAGGSAYKIVVSIEAGKNSRSLELASTKTGKDVLRRAESRAKQTYSHTVEHGSLSQPTGEWRLASLTGRDAGEVATLQAVQYKEEVKEAETPRPQAVPKPDPILKDGKGAITLTLKGIGLRIKDSTGEIISVREGTQAYALGFMIDTRIQTLNGQVYSHDLLKKCATETCKIEIVDAKAKATFGQILHGYDEKVSETHSLGSTETCHSSGSHSRGECRRSAR